MLTVQLWSPDTCGCSIHQVFDDTVPGECVCVSREEAVAVHQARRQAKPTTTSDPKKNPQPEAKCCAAHEHLGETAAKHDACTEENRRKNRAIDLALRNKLNIADDADLRAAAMDKIAQSLHLVSADDFPGIDDLVGKYIDRLYSDIKWSFDADRNLIITHAVTPQEKQRLQTRLNSQFNIKRVIVS